MEHGTNTYNRDCSATRKADSQPYQYEPKSSLRKHLGISSRHPGPNAALANDEPMQVFRSCLRSFQTLYRDLRHVDVRYFTTSVASAL